MVKYKKKEMNLIDKGISYLKDGVRYDEHRKWKEALKNYVLAFEHLLLGMKYLKNERLKQVLKEKVMEFMPRAEEIKKHLETLKVSFSLFNKNFWVINSYKLKNKPNTMKESTGTELSHLRRAIEDTIINLEKKATSFDDVAGLEKAKQSLTEAGHFLCFIFIIFSNNFLLAVLLPQKFPQLFQGKRKTWNGILLYVTFEISN